MVVSPKWAVNASVSRYLSERFAICLLLPRERQKQRQREGGGQCWGETDRWTDTEVYRRTGKASLLTDRQTDVETDRREAAVNGCCASRKCVSLTAAEEVSDSVRPRGEMRNVPSGRFQAHSMWQRGQRPRPYLKEGDRLAWFSRRAKWN